MRRHKNPYCLVLSGGGTKGVYHIGAWRALREMKVPVNAFVGNSIGAIIAGFLAQGAYEALEEIGRTITVDTILDLPQGFKEDGIIKLQPAKMPPLGSLIQRLSSTHGLDTAPMRRTLEAHLNEDAIRNSGNDLGVMTVNVSELKPREVFIDRMESGTVLEYLMASSALPGFAAPEIEGDKYADGGLWDNMPYAMARRRGYRRIIVVDISGAGVNRRPDVAGSETVYIKNSIDFGGVLDFDRAFLDRFNELGYLDTLRVFGKLKGYSYFVKPADRLEKRFLSLFSRQAEGEAPTMFPEAMRHDRNLLLKHLECAATLLEVERVRGYTYRSLAAAIDERRAAEDERLRAFAAEAIGSRKRPSFDTRRGIENLIRESLRKRGFDETPYYIVGLLRLTSSGHVRGFLEQALGTFWPSLDAGLRYFELRDRLRPSL